MYIEQSTKQKLAFRKSLGLRIQFERHKLSLSQEELAERAFLHPTYVSRVENGRVNVSIDNILCIARALGCSAKEIIPD